MLAIEMGSSTDNPLVFHPRIEVAVRDRAVQPLDIRLQGAVAHDNLHIQGAETVASMAVWEKRAVNKAQYRKFQVKTVEGVDDFASTPEKR